MKYKVGQKVRIKTWESMEKEFGVNKSGNIKFNLDETCCFVPSMERLLNEVSPDRILTIRKLEHTSDDEKIYHMKEMTLGNLLEETIEYSLAELEKTFTPINNRFEILDL